MSWHARADLSTAICNVESTVSFSAFASPFCAARFGREAVAARFSLIHSIIGAPSETARLCAACISATNRRDSESSARPRMNRDIAGAAMDVMITSSASTRISSTSVKAWNRPHPHAHPFVQI